MSSESEVDPPVEAKAKLARLMEGGAKEKMQPKGSRGLGQGDWTTWFPSNSLPLSPQGLRMPVPPRPATQNRRDQG